MPKNSFANMTIIEGRKDDVKAALKELQDKLKKFNKCEIVLDNPFYVTAELMWMGDKGFKRVAKNAFVYRKDFDESSFVTDYMILEKSSWKEPSLLVFGAIKRDVIDGFINFFDEMGLSIERIDMSIAGLLKLVTKSLAFDRKNAVINVVDGDLLSICSFRSNGTLFTARTLINYKIGSEDYYRKIAKEVYKHAAFKKTERVREGNPERGYIYIFDMNNQQDSDGYREALKESAITEDYCCVGVRAALSEKMFPDDADVDKFASLLGILTNK